MWVSRSPAALSVYMAEPAATRTDRRVARERARGARRVQPNTCDAISRVAMKTAPVSQPSEG